jgi:hypothetical protein
MNINVTMNEHLQLLRNAVQAKIDSWEADQTLAEALFGGDDDRKDTIMCDAIEDMAAAVFGANQLSEAELNQLIEDLK